MLCLANCAPPCRPWAATTRAQYELGKELGRGQFGICALATNRATGAKVAVKTISKGKLYNPSDIKDAQREVQIMHHLTGHDNIVGLIDTFEDHKAIHLVEEWCSGGELFDSIVAKGHYSERDASRSIKTVLEVIRHCHELGVMHRDLKPENFLLESKQGKARLKATDFGLSTFYKAGDRFKDLVGSAYYVAPEVLKKDYDEKADIWSAGVILFIMLSGSPPFWSYPETEQGIFASILKGKVDFSHAPWPSVSQAAKDTVKRMLVYDAKERPTAADVLQMPWVADENSVSDEPLAPEIVKRMRHFSRINRMKKRALQVVAQGLSPEEIEGLRQMFITMDTDKSGSITFEELREGLGKMSKSRPDDREVRKFMEEMDYDQNGSIDYQEFIAATIHFSKLEKHSNMVRAFEFFDKNGDGFITHDEIHEGLKASDMSISSEEVSDIMKQVDKNGDGTCHQRSEDARGVRAVPRRLSCSGSCSVLTRAGRAAVFWHG